MRRKRFLVIVSKRPPLNKIDLTAEKLLANSNQQHFKDVTDFIQFNSTIEHVLIVKKTCSASHDSDVQIENVFWCIFSHKKKKFSLKIPLKLIF